MMKRQIPLLITFVIGVIMVAQYYIVPWSYLGEEMANWFGAISAFAYVLGAVSLYVVNGKRIRDRVEGWPYNIVLLISLTATLWIGLFNQAFGFGYPGHRPVDEGTAFDWMFLYIQTPLSATMFSLLAFYIASACYRAFKARSIEATLLLGSAFIVMLFRVPLGQAMWVAAGWDPETLKWLIDKLLVGGVSNAGQRAIQVAAAIGLISVSLKIILGIERSYLGGD
jgi:hypothetical protein